MLDAQSAPEKQAIKSQASGLQRGINIAAAGASGVNHGVLSDLTGIPVDAAANALDLGKAGIGYLASKVTGHAPPDWTAPYDRSKIVGSSDWNANKINQLSSALGLKSPIDNPAPDDQIARIASAIGRGVGSSIVPGATASNSQLLKNALMSGAATGSGAIAGEVVPDSQAGQILASFLPQIVTKGSVKTLAMAVRGGEDGRINMAQRYQDLKNGGIDNPSLGLTTGSPLVMGVENLMSKIPGSVGLFQNANASNFSGMKNKVASLRDFASDNFGAANSGTSIQDDLKNSLPSKISSTYGGLLDQLTNQVGRDTPIPVDNSIAAASRLTALTPGAESTSALLKQPKIGQIAKALLADNGGTPAATQTSLVLGADGNPTVTQIAATPPTGIPFQAVKDLRSGIGAEARSKDIVGTPAQAEYKSLYSGMSQDLGNGAALSDLANGILPASAGSASSTWNRSNKYYSAGMDRVDKVQPFANKPSPEQAYNAYVNAANGNVSTLQAVKKSITPETRGKIAATLLNEIGTATPGKQDSTGTVFSPETYLTNYTKMAPQGQSEMFSGFPNSDQVSGGVLDVAKAASMLRDSSKIWANPSGTGGNVMAGSALGSILGNVITNPMAAAGGVAGLMGGNQISKRLLLNPDFVKKMQQAQSSKDPALMSQIQNTILNARIADQLNQ
jgi:hypothetical protein